MYKQFKDVISGRILTDDEQKLLITLIDANHPYEQNEIRTLVHSEDGRHHYFKIVVDYLGDVIHFHVLK